MPLGKQSLSAETTWFGDGDPSVFWPTYQPGHLAATSYIDT